MKTDRKRRWGIDKKVGPATAVNLVQLVTIIWFGASFYTQVNANQSKNEDRFSIYADQRKDQDAHIIKLEEDQNKILIQMSAMTERTNALTDVIKDVRDAVLREPQPRRAAP